MGVDAMKSVNASSSTTRKRAMNEPFDQRSLQRLKDPATRHPADIVGMNLRRQHAPPPRQHILYLPCPRRPQTVDQLDRIDPGKLLRRVAQMLGPEPRP